MSNEVANIFGGNVAVADVASLAKRAAAAAQNDPRGGAPDGSDYLNFSGKQGVYTIGTDKRVIEPDELWLVDVVSFEEGWVCWKAQQPVGNRMANIYSGVPVQQPDPEELGPFKREAGEGWHQAKAMVVKSLDNDQQGYLRINSVSGVSEIAKLIGEFAERAETGQPAWPVIRLDREQFTAQGFKNFKPIFAREGWIDNDQLKELMGGASIEDLLETSVEEPAEVEEQPAPKAATGRRRRR